MELSWLLLQSRISWSKSSLGQELQEKHFPPQATSLWLHISDTMCSYRTRVSAKSQSRIVHRQINNPLWLVFNLSFMHLNLYSPKSYTYVLKCLQKSQISPLPLGIPSKTCFLLKTTEKKKFRKCAFFLHPWAIWCFRQSLEKCVFFKGKNISLSKSHPPLQWLLRKQQRQTPQQEESVDEESKEPQVSLKGGDRGRRDRERNLEWP